MTAQIIQLGSLDDEDEEYIEFLEALKEDAVRAVFIVEKSDGTVYVGTNSKDRRDIVYDVFRLQQFCTNLVNEAPEE